MSIDFTFDKAKKFKFAASCKELDVILSKIGSIMGVSASQTKNYFIISVGKKVCVLAYNQDTFCAIKVANATAESDGAFSFEPSKFQGIIKNRAEMNFEYTGNDLQFKLAKGKYAGNLVTIPVTEEHISFINSSFAASRSKDKKGKDYSIKTSVLAALKEGMAVTAIKDVQTQQDILNYVVLDETGLMVSAFDQHHFSLYKAKVKAKETEGFKVALPANHFTIIDKMVESEDAKFILRPESIRVEGKNFILSLPASQTTPENFEMMKGYVKNLGDIPYEASYIHAKLSTCVENLFTLNSVNTAFDVAFSKDQVKLTFVTPSGSASDVLKVEAKKHKKDGQVRINPAMLKDLINLVKVQAETTLSISQKIFMISIKTKSGATVTLGSALEKS